MITVNHSDVRRLKDFKGEVQSPDGHMLSKSDYSRRTSMTVLWEARVQLGIKTHQIVNSV